MFLVRIHEHDFFFVKMQPFFIELDNIFGSLDRVQDIFLPPPPSKVEVFA